MGVAAQHSIVGSSCIAGDVVCSRADMLAAQLQTIEHVGLFSEHAFEELVDLATISCGTAAGAISLFHGTDLWRKASRGVTFTTVSADQSICLVTASQPGLLVVNDLSQDARFQNLACVTGEEHIRFYAGRALHGTSGHVVGCLCVVDTEPRALNPQQCSALEIVARQVESRILYKLQDHALGNALAINQDLIATLSDANADMKRVVDAIPSIIIGLDSEGRVTYWNAAAERILLLPSETVCGRLLAECGVHWCGERATIDALHLNKTPARTDHPFMMRGEKRWLGVAAQPIDAQGLGSRTKVLITGADITVRLLQEEQARQLHKMEAIGQLAAGIAHEINTPTQYVGDNIDFVQRSMSQVLGVVQSGLALRMEFERRCGKCEALAGFDGSLDGWDLDFVLSEVPEALRQAMDGTQRIGNIVKAMKEFSHPGSQEKNCWDLNHGIDVTVVMSRSEWRYVATMETDLDPELPKVMCYPGEINQVLLNLVVNAAHAIQERMAAETDAPAGSIRITTKRGPDYVQVCVEDNGIGIPPNVQSRVFELFFTTKDVGKGTGQGLAFAHSVVVKKHGGQLWFDSQRFRGTAFYLRLPLEH